MPLRGSKGFFSSLGIPTGKPPRGLLRGSGIFSGSGLVVPFRRCTSVSLRESLEFLILTRFARIVQIDSRESRH